MCRYMYYVLIPTQNPLFSRDTFKIHKSCILSHFFNNIINAWMHGWELNGYTLFESLCIKPIASSSVGHSRFK